MMRVHTLRVRGRAVECDDLTLVQGTVEADAVRLELDEEWAGLAVTVAFIADSERRTPAKNPDGTYTVPWECLAKAGSVRGIVEGRGEDGTVLKHARMERPFRVLASDAAQDAPATGEPTKTELKASIDSAVASTYRPKGSAAFSALPALTAAKAGDVYNVSDAFTTTADFVEGAGKKHPAGTNVACVMSGSAKKWDVMAGFVDLSPYAKTADFQAVSTSEIDAMFA